MIDENDREGIRSALLRIADNVAKHIVQRDGWHQDDTCFRVDLRESEQEPLDLLSRLRDRKPAQET